MRQHRDLFLPSISTLILFGIVWFVSCSHQALNKRKVANNSPLAEEAEVGWENNESSDKLSENSDLSFELAVREQAEKNREVIAVNVHKKENKFSKSQIPQIPEQPLFREGKKLNRFYFLRKGDSVEKLSHLFFSSSNNAQQLRSWNPGRWKPGKLIFYPSSIKPNDAKMISFYAESKIAIEEYNVGEGESLSRISKKLLGDYQSWKELAVVNGLREPDLLKAGTVLGYYPQELTKKLSKPIEEKPKPIHSAQAPQTKNPASLVDQAPSSPAQVVNPPAPEPAKPVQAQMPQKQRPNNPRPPKPPVGWTDKVVGFFKSLWSDTTYWISEFSSDFSRQPSSQKRKK